MSTPTRDELFLRLRDVSRILQDFKEKLVFYKACSDEEKKCPEYEEGVSYCERYVAVYQELHDDICVKLDALKLPQACGRCPHNTQCLKCGH